MSRQLVLAPPVSPPEAPAGGLVLRTLADHRAFELIACCAACERYVVLEHAAMAARFGWGAPLDELRRRMSCRLCRARSGSVLVSAARTRDADGTGSQARECGSGREGQE